MFKEFFIISSLIIIHECGHFFSAKLLGIKTDKIYLYPLGGVSKFYMPIGIDRKKELLILWMGPIFQNIAYILLLLLLKEKELVTRYHLGILLFNLLPIIPLDGGKMIKIITSSMIPYKKSLTFTIWLSYCMTIIILFSQKKISLNIVIMYLVLILLIRKEELKKTQNYEQFLLDRYLHKTLYKKEKTIYKESDFYRYRKNKIIVRGRIQNEDEFLREKYNIFDKKC